MEFQLSINNKRVYDFYAKNPLLNFEQVNILCIDFLENLLQSAATTEVQTSSNAMKQMLHEIGGQVQSMKSSIDTMKYDFMGRINDLKREYIDEMKTIMQGIVSENIRSMIDHGALKTESTVRDMMKSFSQDQALHCANINHEQSVHLSKQMEQSNLQLFERLTYTLMKDMLPEQSKTIQENVKQFVNMHMEETKRMILLNQQTNSDILAKVKESSRSSEEKDELLKLFLAKNKEDQVQLFIENFEKKYTHLIQTLVHNGNDRLLGQMTKQEVVQGKIFSEMEEFLSKYRNSSHKGQLEENHLFCTLTSMFPCANIIDTSKRTSSGDFILTRENRDDILIENKDYKRNVNTEEIQKFIVDCEVQKMHGIFLSQKTGITSKKNYQIDCHCGNFLIYIHECEYLPHKIQVAVDIIDSLAKKTKEISSSSGSGSGSGEENAFWITKEILDDINSEYQKLIAHRELMMTTLKDFHKKMTMQIDSVKIPSLEKYLLDKYASVQKQKYTCEICDLFTSNTIKGLSSHKTSCAKKNMKK
jgi:hypothetical protein